jgi:hypothetical protein
MSESRHNGWHYMRPLRRGSVPRRIIVCDTETYRQEADQCPGETTLRLRLACLNVYAWEDGRYDITKSYVVHTWRDFWHTVSISCRRACPTWLFAHNLGFDLTVTHFWEVLESGWFDLTNERLATKKTGAGDSEEVDTDHGLTVLTDPPVIISGWIDGQKLVMVDWFNYCRQSLEEIAKSLGKMKLPIPAEEQDDDDWEMYCRNDVAILAKSVIGTIEKWHCEIDAPWGYTGPSLAMSAFRRRYLKDRQVLIHRDEKTLELERLSYYGGEIITGYRGVVIDDGGVEDERGNVNEWGEADRSGTVYCLDTNSLYPYVMSTEHLPCKLEGTVYKNDLSYLYGLWPHVQYCAMVRIKSAINTYPVRVDKSTLMPLLPGDYSFNGSFDRTQGRVVYAYGNYWTVLCGRELFQALEQGDIEDVKFATKYSCEPFLKEFADEFYRRRISSNENGDRASAVFYKLILTSLHGKFGQTAGGWEESEACCPPLLWGQWVETTVPGGPVHTRRSLGGRVQKLEAKREHPSSVPIVSASIASAGRWIMSIRRRLLAGDGVYYGDTDSIHTSEAGYRRLQDDGFIDQTEVGKMRLVKVGKYARYVGQKYYKVDADWVHAGIGRTARNVATDVFSFPMFTGVADAIKTNPPGEVQVKEIQKRIAKIPLSGRLLPDGTVVPHEIRD